MTFRLSFLGQYRVERTEDYDNYTDKSYSEIIRVRGSKSESPAFSMPSHIFKYSESELGLCLKDKKNKWRNLAKLLNSDIDISDEEIILVFPRSRFREVSRIMPLVRKRGMAMASDDDKKNLIARLQNNGKKSPNKMKQTETILDQNSKGHNITLETFYDSSLLPDRNEPFRSIQGIVIDEPIIPGDVPDGF